MTFFIFFYSSVSHMRVRITFIPSTHACMHAHTLIFCKFPTSWNWWSCN